MTALKPAQDLDEMWEIFDPATTVDATSAFYVPRNEDGLRNLTFNLKKTKRHFHGFLCGHVGSGKTTELHRLRHDPKINELYFPLMISVLDLKIESINLTHDALLVEIGRLLIERTSAKELDPVFSEELADWGKTLIKTFVKDESTNLEAGGKGNAWFAYFKASLSSRSRWKEEEKSILEPKVQDLINILNRMAVDLKNKTGKRLLVMFDDMEKGDSDADKTMHQRLFLEYYGVLTQPAFTIIYTLPVYFKALPGSRIDKDTIYSFSAIRIYEPDQKGEPCPKLNAESEGYQQIHDFIAQRLDSSKNLLEKDVLDEIIRIGGGLFRETARALKESAYYALMRDAEAVAMQDIDKVYNKLKKEYQPIIRGEAIAILQQVADCKRGWVEGVEPFLQSRAVVEYENGDVWLDIRYVLKAYLKSLTAS
jgi:hypothetical protein